MTTCHDTDDRLDAYLDGELDSAGRADVEAHLATCARCRALLEDLRALQATARAAPRQVPVPHRVWDGVRMKSPRPRRMVAVPAWVLAAAAAMLVALGALGALWLRTAPVLPAAPPAVLPGELAELERNYLQAAEELAAALEARRGELGADALASLERSLVVVDAAIAEARAAAVRAPDATAPLLLAAHERKLALLEQAMRLLTTG